MSYALAATWNARYAQDPYTFEWFGGWPLVKELVREQLKSREASILHVGCGTSNMDIDLHEEGYTRVTNIDFSDVVIRLKQEKFPALSYRVADVTQLTGFASETFDAVLDKGTLDSVMCAENAMHETDAALSEVSRVLKSDGVFMSFSYAIPSTRLHIFDKPALQWQVCCRTIPRSVVVEGAPVNKPFYCYICRKRAPARS